MAVVRARSLPIVLTVHCSLAHTLRVTDARSVLLRALGGPIERRGERRAAATLVYTRPVADRIAADARRVVVMRRGVDREAFADPGTDPFPDLRGRPRVIFIGRLVPQKGVNTLVEAAARLRTPGAEVVLIGDGPERTRLERRIQSMRLEDRVHITGFVSHELVPAAAQRAPAYDLERVGSQCTPSTTNWRT